MPVSIALVGRRVSPESLEKDTLDRTVGREFVHPRDFARVALAMQQSAFRRTIGGQRLPMGGVTYEQPPGVIQSLRTARSVCTDPARAMPTTIPNK